MTRPDALRRAYEAARLADAGWSFQRAMSDPTMRRCLEHTADTIERRVVQHRVTRYGDTYHCICGRQWGIDEPNEGCRQ